MQEHYTDYFLLPPGDYAVVVVGAKRPYKSKVKGAWLIRTKCISGTHYGGYSQGYFPPHESGDERTLNALSSLLGKAVSAGDRIRPKELKGKKGLVRVTHEYNGNWVTSIDPLPEEQDQDEAA